MNAKSSPDGIKEGIKQLQTVSHSVPHSFCLRHKSLSQAASIFLLLKALSTNAVMGKTSPDLSESGLSMYITLMSAQVRDCVRMLYIFSLVRCCVDVLGATICVRKSSEGQTKPIVAGKGNSLWFCLCYYQIADIKLVFYQIMSNCYFRASWPVKLQNFTLQPLQFRVQFANFHHH